MHGSSNSDRQGLSDLVSIPTLQIMLWEGVLASSTRSFSIPIHVGVEPPRDFQLRLVRI